MRCSWKTIGGGYARLGVHNRKREHVVSLAAGIAGGSLGGPWVRLTPDGAPLAPIIENSAEIFAIDWKAPWAPVLTSDPDFLLSIAREVLAVDVVFVHARFGEQVFHG